jgi:hypothetical protein
MLKFGSIEGKIYEMNLRVIVPSANSSALRRNSLVLRANPGNAAVQKVTVVWYAMRPTIYKPTPTCHLSSVCTPSHPKPMPKAIMERQIRMLGRHDPKSAKEPSIRKTITCRANEIPLLSRTIELIDRVRPRNSSVSESPAAWYIRFWKAVGPKLNNVSPLSPT